LSLSANVVPSSPMFVTLMKVAICFSETSILTRATRRNTTEDGILHSHIHENHKFYININLFRWTRTHTSKYKFEILTKFYIFLHVREMNSRWKLKWWCCAVGIGEGNSRFARRTDKVGGGGV
jgi:hypothetical protein